MITSRWKNNSLNKIDTIDGIEVHWLNVSYNNDMNYARRILAFIQFSILSTFKVLQLRGDIIFATSTPLTIAIPAILGKWIKRIPMVFEVRDLWPELPIAMGAIKNPILKRLASALENIAYKNSNHVVGLSPGMCEGIQARGIKDEKITLIPNSSDFDRFEIPQSSGMSIRREREWLGNRPLVLYAGTFGRINGISWLADLAGEVKKINPEVRFLALGEGYERKKLEKHADDLNILGKSFFIEGPVPKSQVPLYVSAATICCSLFIPLDEMTKNSANKFYDGLAAGKPILINYTGWHKDLINENDLGLVADNEKIYETAKILVEMINNEDDLKRKGANSSKVAHQQFSRDALAQKLGDILAAELPIELQNILVVTTTQKQG